MKTIKKKVALLLVTCMVAAVCSGCGQQTKFSDENKQSSKSTSTEKGSVAESASKSQEEKEIFTIKHLSFGQPDSTDNFKNYVKDSEVYKELVKQTRCEIEEYGLDDDQVNIRISSGQLGDMIKVYNTTTLDTMVQSDLLLPLNDLLAEYAPEILENYADVLEYVADYYGDGNIYTLPVYVGSSGFNPTVLERSLYSIRWDLYKELGYPEIKNPDDLIEVLADMVELEPKTPEGKNVYGTSFYVSNTSFFGMIGNFRSTYGFVNLKGHYISCDKNLELVYDMIDEVGPYWMAVDFYNKAYRAGILDPDSFTQQGSDYESKIESGEILCNIFNGKAYNIKQFENNPKSIKGFVEIPVEGTQMDDNCDNKYGWGVAGNSISIPKSCENPQRVMEFIAYCFSEDGSRLLQSGVEGVHWDYVDGVPTFNEETVALAVQVVKHFLALV